MGTISGLTVTKLYEITITRHGSKSVELSATNRHGRTFVCWVIRDKKNWFGGSDFETNKVTFKGIMYDFFRSLINEARTYDLRFYRFNSYITHESKNKTRSLTWEESRIKKDDNEKEPNFQGGLEYESILK